MDTYPPRFFVTRLQKNVISTNGAPSSNPASSVP